MGGQEAHPFSCDSPVGQTAAPAFGCRRRKLLDAFVFAACVVYIDPGLKISRLHLWKLQQQVSDVPFGVDQQGGHLVQGSLFEQSEAEPGLATAGHPNTDGMRHQIARVVVEGGLGSLTIFQVVDRAQIE